MACPGAYRHRSLVIDDLTPGLAQATVGLMSRPSGKTFRQPIGAWPRHRVLKIELEGSRAWPDSGPSDRRASQSVHALQGEDDVALRRAVHHALDELLDEILPQLPQLQEWVIWPSPGGPARYTVWHRVEKRTPSTLKLLCESAKLRARASAIFSQETNNWGRCPDCHAERIGSGDFASRQIMASPL